MIDYDTLKIVAIKGFELAEALLDPDVFYSISKYQAEGKIKPFIYDKTTSKLTVQTPSGIREVDPRKVVESGVAVCKDNNNNIFFAEGKKHGMSMEISPDFCKPKGEYIGSLHTHPGGSLAPSPGDLIASNHNRDKFMCIASRVGTKQSEVNCYVPIQEFLPEEIAQIDAHATNVIKRWSDNNLAIVIHDKNQKTKTTMLVPVQSRKRVPWFSESLLSEIEPYYRIYNFKNEI